MASHAPAAAAGGTRLERLLALIESECIGCFALALLVLVQRE